MLWLNNFLSVPILGIEIQPDFQLMVDYPNIFAPLVNEIQEKEGSVNVGYENPKSLIIESDSGRIFQFTSKDILIRFNYTTEKQQNSKRVPKYKDIEIRKYEELLSKSIEDLIKVLKTITENRPSIKLKRIGIVAKSFLTKNTLPPGVSSLIDELNSPWKHNIVRSVTTLTPIICKTDNYLERCHYTINFDCFNDYLYEEDVSDYDIDIMLDWQRVYKEKIKLNSNNIGNLITECQGKALEYFQNVGEGKYEYNI